MDSRCPESLVWHGLPIVLTISRYLAITGGIPTASRRCSNREPHQDPGSRVLPYTCSLSLYNMCTARSATLCYQLNSPSFLSSTSNYTCRHPQKVVGLSNSPRRSREFTSGTFRLLATMADNESLQLESQDSPGQEKGLHRTETGVTMSQELFEKAGCGSWYHLPPTCTTADHI